MIAIPQPCEHLEPVIQFLRSQGVTITEGFPWGTVTLKLDCAEIVNADVVKQHVPIVPPLEFWEITHYAYAQEQGIMCMEHHHTVAWPHPMTRRRP
ncbi:MAG TPA: hypothetical protein VGK74_17250 [Symbiobacteriaceae bacterium]|jgi:hypothetical protein